MKNKIIIGLFFCIFFLSTSYSQNAGTDSGGQVLQIQPKVIVIPYAKADEVLQTMLQDEAKGFYRRTAISVVNDAFNARSFTTYGYEAELTKAINSGLFNSNTKKSQKEIIASNCTADIFVETDLEVNSGGNGTEVQLILRAYETATGRALSDKQSASGKFYTNDITKLTIKALDKVKEDFLNDIQTKFNDIVNNGRSIEIYFSLSKNPPSKKNFNIEVGTNGNLLSEEIMDWMTQNSYKKYAKKRDATALEVVYNEVRIPLKDQATGDNYDIQTFGRLIRKFLKSLGVDAVIDYPPGQITVTLN